MLCLVVESKVEEVGNGTGLHQNVQDLLRFWSRRARRRWNICAFDARVSSEPHCVFHFVWTHLWDQRKLTEQEERGEKREGVLPEFLLCVLAKHVPHVHVHTFQYM